MGFPVDRRSIVTAILEAEHIPVLKPGEMRNGIAVSPNGLVVRVTVVDDIDKPALDVLKARLAFAAAVLRSRGVAVLEKASGVEIALGAISIEARAALHS
jgi:hypothetical protein